MAKPWPSLECARAPRGKRSPGSPDPASPPTSSAWSSAPRSASSPSATSAIVRAALTSWPSTTAPAPPPNSASTKTPSALNCDRFSFPPSPHAHASPCLQTRYNAGLPVRCLRGGLPLPELRKDPITGRWVIISTDRGKRPTDFLRESVIVTGPKNCPFCPGAENKTPPEILVYGRNRGRATTPGSNIRAPPTPLPALRIEGDLHRQREALFDKMNAVRA